MMFLSVIGLVASCSKDDDKGENNVNTTLLNGRWECIKETVTQDGETVQLNGEMTYLEFCKDGLLVFSDSYGYATCWLEIHTYSLSGEIITTSIDYVWTIEELTEGTLILSMMTEDTEEGTTIISTWYFRRVEVPAYSISEDFLTGTTWEYSFQREVEMYGYSGEFEGVLTVSFAAESRGIFTFESTTHIAGQDIHINRDGGLLYTFNGNDGFLQLENLSSGRYLYNSSDNTITAFFNGSEDTFGSTEILLHQK